MDGFQALSRKAGALLFKIKQVPRRPLSSMTSNTDLLNGNYQTINVSSPIKHVALIQLNRPKQRNAVNRECVRELIDIIYKFEADTNYRCAVMTGTGPDFTAGLDLKSAAVQFSSLTSIEEPARRAKKAREMIESFQEPFKVLDRMDKPIIASIHGNCIGLGMELVASCDIRYCSAETNFSIKEVKIGLAADVGSLQKLPKLMSNQSFLNELILTGRGMTAEEALQFGLVSRICGSPEATLNEALKCGDTISKISPVAVQGSKVNLRFSQNQPFTVGLDYVATWNMSMIQSDDVMKSIGAIVTKSEEPDFESY